MPTRHPLNRCSRPLSLATSALTCCLLSACSGGGGSASVGATRSTDAVHFDEPLARLHRKASSNPIQHVVVIIQENQSFDHLFNGYPGANTVSTGMTHTGTTVPLVQQHLGAGPNTEHFSTDFLLDYDGGRMDGFDLNTASEKPYLGAYHFVDPNDIQPYIQMANQYVLSDNYFSSHIDASFVAHQYLIAAQANQAVDVPSGRWGCSVLTDDFVASLNPDRTVGALQAPCFNYTTLADELDSAGLTWHDYSPGIQASGGAWSPYQAVSHIYNGPDWKADVISPETQILEDIPNGILSNVTWVTPDTANSDHPGSGSLTGPSWVASIVNAIGESPFWDSTVIFVTWDEWGGEYDHVPPPYEDYDGDGFRVPLLCISPYAYSGVVNHTQLESAGIPKFIEKTFGLATLAAADARATPADSGCTNPSLSTPRTFTGISASYSRNYFLHEKHHNVPPDDY